jgi:DNA-binding beta-propeller fold protein YncE
MFDPGNKALRPILGIPGAATLGRPLEVGVEFDTAAVSPLQDYVLLTTGEPRTVELLTLSHQPLAPKAIHGVERAPDLITFSPGGGSAALYHKYRGLIQVLTGLRTSPRVSAELYLSGRIPPSALAVSEDGGAVLAGVDRTVYWVSPSGEVPLIKGLSKITAIAFTVGHAALVADGAKNLVYRVSAATTAAVVEVVAGPKEGVNNPVALALSRDNRHAFVANSKSGGIVKFDLQEKTAVEKISCGCAPAVLDRLGADDVFRLTAASERPMWVLDAAGQKSRVVFVPVDVPRSSGK